MATNKTSFLNMNDWVGTDPFRREEINANFRTLDAKAKEHDDKLGDLTTLGTTEKGSLVKAVNEVTSSLAQIETYLIDIDAGLFTDEESTLTDLDGGAF